MSRSVGMSVGIGHVSAAGDGLGRLTAVGWTGRTGALAARLRDRRGSPQWWAQLLSAVGFACAVAAPLAELAGPLPISVLDRTPVRPMHNG